MYVMAAVDCDVESIKEGSLEKNNDSIYGGPAAIGGPRFFEKVLCTIKLFSNNTMEATPGFSEEVRGEVVERGDYIYLYI